MELSQLAQELGGSAIRKMFNAALLIEDTIKFTVGEPDFMTPLSLHWSIRETRFFSSLPHGPIISDRSACAGGCSCL